MNRSLEEVLATVEDEALRERLRIALAERDRSITDNLMLKATEQGLKPSMTRLLILQCGLGDVPPVEELHLLERQAHEEFHELQRQAEELNRRLRGDGS